jgi:hypothetical protein
LWAAGDRCMVEGSPGKTVLGFAEQVIAGGS